MTEQSSRLNRILRQQALTIIGAALGGIAFVVIFGVEILAPTNIGWLMEGDAAAHFLGWHFFRDDPWTFPLGAFQSLNYPEGSSIVYTDSIPLFALFFKLFSPLLPYPFQYQGMWHLFCWILIGIFSIKLLFKITDSPTISIFGSLFFLFSPIAIWRSCGHETLSAHWILLASFCFYIESNTKKANIQWFVLLVVASTVHFYLLFMAVMIWIAFLCKNILINRNHHISARSFLAPGVTILGLLTIMLAAGYFILPADGASSGGFGVYSMNLNALWNPMAHAFTFLDPRPAATEGAQEGFNYLGCGMLFLVLASLIILSQVQFPFSNLIRRNFPLIIVLLILSVFALSNRVYFDKHLLIDIDLPHVIYKVFGVLRSSGRLFWPAYYGIMILPFIVFARLGNRFLIFGLLLLSLILQFIDIKDFARSRYGIGGRDWTNPLQSSAWDLVIRDKSIITFVPNRRSGDDYVPFALLAADNDKAFSTGYFARDYDDERSAKETVIWTEFVSGNLDPKRLYIIRENQFIKPSSSSSYFTGVIDGEAFLRTGGPINHPDIMPWPLAYTLDWRPLSLHELITNLTSDEYLLIAARDEARANMPADFANFLQRAGSRIKELEYRGSYALIFHRGAIIHEQVSNSNKVSLESMVGNSSVRVVSGGLEFGNVAQLWIDGRDHSINSRGLNVVIFNPSSVAIKRYAFDTHGIVNPRVVPQ